MTNRQLRHKFTKIILNTQSHLEFIKRGSRDIRGQQIVTQILDDLIALRDQIAPMSDDEKAELQEIANQYGVTLPASLKPITNNGDTNGN